MRTDTFVTFVRRVGETSPGTVVGRATYRALASIAARWLQELPNVHAVYATGSLKSEWLRPGYSDVDLVVIAEFRTDDEQLALRTELRRRLDVLNRVAPIFRDLDYLDVSDLPLLCRHPDNWALHAGERWILLAGEPLLREHARAAPPIAHPEEDVIQAFAVVRRWTKAGSYLLDPRVQRGPAIEVRGAQRLLADALAALARVDRQTSLPELVARGEQLLGGVITDRCHHLARLAPQHGARADVEYLLATTLEVTGALLERTVARWTGTWEPFGVEWNTPDGADPVIGAAERAGFSRAVVASRLGGSGLVLLLPPAESPGESIQRLVRLLAGCPPLPASGFTWAPNPVLLLPGMWRAAALLDPAPLVGAQLAGSEPSHGDATPRVRRPTPAHFDLLVDMMMVRQLRRVRNRRFRFNKTRSAFVRELQLAREYARLKGADAPPVPDSSSEAELLSLHERWVEEWRPRLER